MFKIFKERLFLRLGQFFSRVIPMLLLLADAKLLILKDVDDRFLSIYIYKIFNSFIHLQFLIYLYSFLLQNINMATARETLFSSFQPSHLRNLENAKQYSRRLHLNLLQMHTNQLKQRTRLRTQFVEDHAHLCIELKSIFPPVLHPSTPPPQPPSDDTVLETNFNISINNPYSFILLHLRNKSQKNPLNILIPEVCIFHDKIPYDIIYHENGYIRGYKGTDHPRLFLRDMNKFFKQAWNQHMLPKTEQCIACFAQKQMLMVSDNDLYLISCKNKLDPFFKKLRYITNKLPTNNNSPIIVQHNHEGDEETDNIILKLATQSLLGNISEQECIAQLSHFEDSNEKYLLYMNKKIFLFLNYEHNIRIQKCKFVYKKTDEGLYYLVNVHQLQFTNLTGAIIQRQKRLARLEQERNKILIMTPEKQIRYRSFESRENVKTYEHLMNKQFNSIVQKMNFNKISDNKRQQVKNELAFKKLHPHSRFTYTQLFTSSNFMKVKDEVLENSNRKPITKPSKYVMRFYNKIDRSRIKTQSQVQFDN